MDAPKLAPALTLALIAMLALAGAGLVVAAEKPRAPVPRVPKVDLSRYMGDWFVLGAIGLGLEKGAHNAVETYRLNDDGSIRTIFAFAEDAFDGPLDIKRTTAWVKDTTSNAEWRVRTVWPLRQQYVISHLEPDYSAAIIARDKRDHVWILSRTPRLDGAQIDAYRARIAAMGYDLSKFTLYPQDGRLPQASAQGGDSPD